MNDRAYNSDIKLDFDSFIEIIKDASVNFDGGYAVINISRNINPDIFKDYLKQFGVISKIEYEEKDNGSEISFSIMPGGISKDSNIFLNIDSFWISAQSTLSTPQKYIILQTNLNDGNKGVLTSKDNSTIVNQIKLFTKWAKLVKNISAHYLDGKCIYYIPNKDNGKEIIIPLSTNIIKIKSLTDDAKSLDSVEHLLRIIAIDDGQTSERQSILRSALADFISKEDSLFSLINAGERVFNRYKDLLDLYTKRFSINNILSEIESKSLEYTTKINEFVSSSQNKAFAIPGALIAIAALIKADNIQSGFLVIIGLLMIFIITFMSNNVYKESYNNLSEGLKESFSRYKELEHRAEIRTEADKTEKKLQIRILKAQKRLSVINNMGGVMLLIGVILIYYNNYEQITSVFKSLLDAILECLNIIRVLLEKYKIATPA